ncbi:MAG TPA: carboxypeptidase-like regulatory domain-containing protein, partial [Candidatus Thermoplasmatota archaeon]
MRRQLSWWPGMAAILLSLTSSPAAGQTGVLTGRVVDAATAQPITGAQIQIVSGPASGEGTLTNESGQFRFQVPAGTYSLTVHYVGSRTQRVDGVQVSTGQTREVTVALESDAFALDEIVVTGSKKAERKTEAPVTMAVVSGQEVQETPSTTPAGHLYETPGTDIMQTGLQATNVVVRGFNNIFSGALYALTDHRIAGVPSLRVNFLHFVPSTDDDIERIEVALGPGSALYGPNTQNGVLHILTKSPLSNPATVVSVAGGEREVFKGMFRTSHVFNDQFGIKFSGQLL